MAFTLSHMAAALPFYRCQQWLSFEALLLGTMLPDLPYFLNSSSEIAQHSHRWSGLWQYCLPWGLAVFAIWHWLLKPATMALLYPWGRIKYLQYRDVQAAKIQYPFGAWLVAQLQYYSGFWRRVIAGLLLGASTHLIWDGVTHPDGFIAQHLVWLQQPVYLADFTTMPLARLLQYVSSLVGLLYLASFINQHMQAVIALPLEKSSTPIIVFKKWNSLFIGFLVCFASLFCGWQAMLKWHNLIIPNSYLFFAKVLVGLLQGAIVSLTGYAIAYWILGLIIRQTAHCHSK